MNGAFLAAGHIQLGKTFQKINETAAAKKQAAAGKDLQLGSTFVDADNNHYSVVDQGVDAKGSFVVAEAEDGHAYKAYNDQLKGGKVTIMTKADRQRLLEAQKTYAQRTVPTDSALVAEGTAGDDSAAQSHQTQTQTTAKVTDDSSLPQDGIEHGSLEPEGTVGDEIAKNPNSPLAKMVEKDTEALVSMSPAWDKFPTEKHQLVKTVLKGLRNKDLEVLDRKLKTTAGREEFAEKVPKLSETCSKETASRGTGMDEKDNGFWDKDGTFMGILYAQNSDGLSCQNL